MRPSRIFSIATLAALTLLGIHGNSQGQRFGGGAAANRGGSAVVGPYGGGGASAHSRATVIGPAGGASTTGASRGSYTTNQGTSIDYGKAGAARVGPNGGVAAGGVGGIKVTGPGGKSASKVGWSGGAIGPNGNGIGGGGSIAVGSGPNGSAASIKRGGVAVGPGGAIAGGSRVGAVSGPGGTVVGGSRGGVAVNHYGLAGYGPGRGGSVVVGHRTQYVPVATLQTRGVYVRRSFVHYNVFAPNWYVAHPNAWRVPAWTAVTIWRAAAWATLAARCAYPVQPIVYDYGTTVVYQGDTVIVWGEPVGTPAEYSQQAIDLAAFGQAARTAETEEWVPLGVFGMVQGDERDANDIFQLAINKSGILRGNYYNALSDTTVPVFGSVDKKTQRAAWVVGEKKDTVYETGIANLTEAETTMLVHFGKDRTQQWTLVRLEPPQDK